MLKRFGMSIGFRFLGSYLSDLSDLRNRHSGETIWVLGSGTTLRFIKPSFFDDKIVVSTNFAAKVAGIKADYVFSHYHADLSTLIEQSNYAVTLRRDTVSHREWTEDIPDNLVFVNQDSYSPPGASWNPFTTHTPLEDSLVYGSSSIHGSMHLAAWLGASSIVLVGADCGVLDGSDRIPDYPQGDTPWALYNLHHKLMKDWLADNYGVAVYSLNPFINLNLEGHKFEGV
jgi:hypothetical protein